MRLSFVNIFLIPRFFFFLSNQWNKNELLRYQDCFVFLLLNSMILLEPFSQLSAKNAKNKVDTFKTLLNIRILSFVWTLVDLRSAGPTQQYDVSHRGRLSFQGGNICFWVKYYIGVRFRGLTEKTPFSCRYLEVLGQKISCRLQIVRNFLTETKDIFNRDKR